MRRLVITENCSVDGIVAPMGDWFDPADQDPEVAATTAEHSAGSDALVLGRSTFEAFRSYWPDQVGSDTTGVAAYLDEVRKYCVSRTVTDPVWQRSTVLAGIDEVVALKSRAGADITVTGSLSVARSLLAAGAVDLVRLFVYPAVQGSGEQLFPSGWAARCTLSRVKTHPSGVVLLEYRLDD
jgi:dihydrofolate reductase